MITGKLLGLLAAVIVICIAASGLVGWGVASATLASSHPKTAAGASASPGVAGANGSNGKAGANGKDGSDGTDGANGAAGSTGATGATGATGPAGAVGAQGSQGSQGVQGTQGLQGEKGDTGASGASAPSFAVTSASGMAIPIFPQQNFGNPIGVPVQIPAGPALVGFTVTITDPFVDFSTCSLVDATTLVVIASAAPVLLSSTPTTVSTTQVVTLAAPTTLQLQCGPTVLPNPDTYTGLSVYAISFATS